MEAGTVVVSKGEPRPALGRRLVGIEIDFGPLPLLKEDRGTSTDKSQRTDPAWIRGGGGLAPVARTTGPCCGAEAVFPAPEIPGEFEQRERARRGSKIFLTFLFSLEAGGAPFRHPVSNRSLSPRGAKLAKAPGSWRGSSMVLVF